jgi:hypothetical protein
MSDDRAKQYQLAVEWHNPFAGQQNRGLVVYTLSLPPEGNAEELDTFVHAELAPAIEGILTRAIQYGPVYVLAEAGKGGPDPLRQIQAPEVAKKLAALSTPTVDRQYVVVLNPGSNAAE